MKRLMTLCIALCSITGVFGQTDTTKKEAPDTIKVGGMVIIREKGSQPEEKQRRGLRINSRRNRDKPSNISTNWWILDLGFSNYYDNTNYSSAAAQALAPGSTEDWFKLRGGKSRNVNFWFLMQRINMIKHVVNLKYGVGIELNNYHFEDERIRFDKSPTLITLDPALEDAKKNKLAADYLTVPVMLNFNFTPRRTRSYGFSAGVSAGFLYSARHKTKIDGDKDKTRSDFDLERWKLSYVGEILLGRVKLYGSYAMNSMWDKGFDQTPYTVGFRLSSW